MSNGLRSQSHILFIPLSILLSLEPAVKLFRQSRDRRRCRVFHRAASVRWDALPHSQLVLRGPAVQRHLARAGEGGAGRGGGGGALGSAKNVQVPGQRCFVLRAEVAPVAGIADVAGDAKQVLVFTQEQGLLPPRPLRHARHQGVGGGRGGWVVGAAVEGVVRAHRASMREHGVRVVREEQVMYLTCNQAGDKVLHSRGRDSCGVA
mmetsp:Transcript_626/g.1315  ORF Transcript_626/g.1315 Transcript_626/m.1315 type:complete len:206 (-) Transcript_626:128-745(-)